MGRRSVTKGKVFEREIARVFSWFMPGSESRRGLSQCRGGGAEEADVVNPVFHIECKRQKRPNLTAAYKQAVDDSAQGKIPIAVTRQDREQALVTLGLDDFMAIVGNWYKSGAMLQNTIECRVDEPVKLLQETNEHAETEPTDETET